MKTTAIVLLTVACAAVSCTENNLWIKSIFNEASIRLFDMKQDKYLGAINLSQATRFSATRATDLLGRLWGLPAGKYFGVVYPMTGKCEHSARALQTYDENIKGARPLTLFFDEMIDLNEHEFINTLKNISLSRDEKNNIIYHTVLIYPVTWDQSGPLDSYFQSTGPTAVACGIVTLGLIQPHIFQVPSAPIPK